MAEHTTGPWHIAEPFRLIIASKESPYICEVAGLQDARLIAKSPDVLRYLEWATNRLENVHGENPNVDYMINLRRVITEAKGE